MNWNYLLLNICVKLITAGLSFLLLIATTPSMITPVKLISSSLSLEISAFSPFVWISVIVGKVMKKWNSVSRRKLCFFFTAAVWGIADVVVAWRLQKLEISNLKNFKVQNCPKLQLRKFRIEAMNFLTDSQRG